MAHADGPGRLELLALGVAMTVVLVLGAITLSTHREAGTATRATLTAAEVHPTNPAPARRTNPVSPILFGLVLASLGVTLVVIRDRKPKADGIPGPLGAHAGPGGPGDDFAGTPSLRSGERWFAPVEGGVEL